MQSAQSEGVRPGNVQIERLNIPRELLVKPNDKDQIHLKVSKPDDPLQLLHILLLTLISLTEGSPSHPRPGCEYPT